MIKINTKLRCMNILSQKAYNNSMSFVIALDGPSASGKGLIGQMLADELNLQYVQSSIVYRGLAYLCIKNNIDPSDSKKIIDLSKAQDLLEQIRNIDLNFEDIGNYASKISVIPEVRNHLNEHLRKMIQNNPRILMEGRDVGTVVANKEADLKIFITADVNKRAIRRYKQLRDMGKECILSDVLELLMERDARDMSRQAAPLRASDDALIIDTGDLSPKEVVLNIKNYIG